MDYLQRNSHLDGRPHAPDLIRVLHRAVGTTGAWSEITYWDPDVGGGIKLLSWVRRALPKFGEARLQLRYGKVYTLRQGGIVYDTSQGKTQGDAWNPYSSSVSKPDLEHHEIRIQHAPFARSRTGANWRTLWHGVCVWQQQMGHPGSRQPSGDYTLHCIDALAYYTQKWLLDHCGGYVNSTAFADVDGHPGYNVDAYGNAAPNRDGSSTTYTRNGEDIISHAMPHSNDAAYWTDQQVVEHALLCGRQVNGPTWTVYGQTALLGGTEAWPVEEGERVWSLLERVANRSRGRGILYHDWADDTGAATGNLTHRLTVRPQTYDDVTASAPVAGGSSTLPGANSAGNTVTVDLVGDQRVTDWYIGQRAQYTADYIETVGGRIVSVVTLSYEDTTLERRWDSTEQTTFDGEDADDRKLARYHPVYCAHDLPIDWDGQAGDGNGGAKSGCLYKCDDDGSLSVAGSDETPRFLLELLRRLPLREGYDYTTSPASRYDGQTEIQERGELAPMVWLRLADDSFLDATEAPGVRLRLAQDGLRIDRIQDLADGLRTIGDTSVSALRSQYNYTQLAVTVAIRGPYRMRMATGDATGTRKRIFLPHLRLEVLHPGAIVKLGAVSGSGRAAGRSSAGMAVHTDMDRLAFLHALAVAWYDGTRVPCRWGLSYPEMAAGSYTIMDRAGATTQVIPTIGQMPDYIIANGEKHTVRTPITEVAYDHDNVRCTWQTDFADLDFRRIR